MRMIAASIVIFSGGLLWGASVLGYSIARAADSGPWYGTAKVNMATWGGIGLVVLGVALVSLAFYKEREA